MSVEDRVITLIDEGNPIPDPDDLDRDRLDAAAYLATLETRSSDVTELETKQHQDETKKKQSLWWLAAAAVVIMAGIGLIVVNQDSPESVAAASFDIANDYMLAVAAHDGAAQLSMLAAGAKIDDLGLTVDEIIANNEFYAATGWDFLEPTCIEPDPSAPNAVVCTYVMQNDWGRTLGVGPFEGSSYQFVIENGKITELTHIFDFEPEFSWQVWTPTRRWVAVNYPDDVPVMYDQDASPVEKVNLDPASIELWRQHTEEFVVLGGANPDQ